MLANDGGNPRYPGIDVKRINIEKIREIESASGSLEGRGIKMHPFGRGIASVCVCKVEAKAPAIIAEFNRSLPGSLQRTASDCLKRTGCGKREEKHGKRTEGKKKGDKESDIARRGGEQKKRFRRLPATETPRNRRRQGGGEGDGEIEKGEVKEIKGERRRGCR